MRNGVFQDGNFYQVLLCIVHTLLNSSLNLLGFSQAIADYAVFISNHDYSRKPKGTASLCNLDNTIDSNKAFFELYLA